MPSKTEKSRMLRYLLTAVLLAAAYFLRDQIGGGSSDPIDPSSFPAQVDSSYETLQGCRILFSGGNDGDSFRVSHRGDEHTFRLYFVDCPETSDEYPDRIGHQARYFGNLSPAETIAVGRKAKAFTLDLLDRHPFAIQTRWETVMNSDRYHAFVLVETEPGKSEYLSEILVRNGLARIYTLGAPLPDGTSRAAFEAKLKSLEEEARAARVGAWENRAK